MEIDTTIDIFFIPMTVSEELSSMEIWKDRWWDCKIGKFQKNLVVWKLMMGRMIPSMIISCVSEELSSMEIYQKRGDPNAIQQRVSEELSSMEIKYAQVPQGLQLHMFQKNLVVWKFR